MSAVGYMNNLKTFGKNRAKRVCVLQLVEKHNKSGGELKPPFYYSLQHGFRLLL